MKFSCFAMLALALSAGAATNRLVVAEGPDWVPIGYRRDIVAGSAMDFSSVVAADAPAGKHGWLKNVGGHFEFERLPGVKQRFYGANLTRSANLVDHQTADRLMDRFVRLGYNALRLHQHDDAIMTWTNGVLRLNEVEMDRLDYLVAAAIRRGIYVTTDLYVCRRVTWRQVGVDQDGMVPGSIYKAFVGSHPGIRADWCAAAKLFLDHVNPYTGRRYADEPGMPFLSLANEGAITQSWEGSRSQPFVREAWKRWLGERRTADPARYGMAPDDSEKVQADFWKGKGQPTWHEEVYAFAADLERANFTVERDFVRSLGAKALLTSVNYYARSKDFRALRAELFDYADNHFYVDHPSSFSGVSSAPMNNPAKIFPHELASSASARAPGLPLTITEWNWCPPSRYRNGSGLLVGAMAALQDWDGLWHFDYSSHHYTVDHDYHLTHFQIAADPVLMIVDHAMACLYRRGDMEADPSKVTEDCKTAEKVLRQAIELDSTNGAYAVVTPRTCGFFAETGRKQAGALEATISGAPAAVWASSLDAADLRNAARILLVHLTDVASEGAVFTGERLNVEENSGGNRYLARVGRAEVSLQLNHPERYAVWALATDGERRVRLKTTIREDRLSFTADVARDRQDGTFLYEIERLSDAPGGFSRYRFDAGATVPAVYYDAYSPLEDGSRAEVAVVLIHGWGGHVRTLLPTFTKALSLRAESVAATPYVIAPMFPRRETLQSNREPSDGRAVWGDSWANENRHPDRMGSATDDWRGGGDANGTNFSSYDYIDLIFGRLADRGRYPNLKRVVLAGFSAGGQFAGRYAATGKGIVREGVKVEYVAMSPSTEFVFEPDQPWLYGLKGRPRYSAKLTETDIMKNLCSRRVWRGCGSKDVLGRPQTSLDMTPPAVAQGKNRYERFVNFQRYLERYPEWKRQVSFHTFEGVGHKEDICYPDPALLDFIFGSDSRGSSTPAAPVGAAVGGDRLVNVAAIPVLVDSAEIGYVGSIDPSGGNADWDWGEVQDENGEWVLFEDFGPGCVYNFTQHRGETVEVPVFRFYFDGEKSPRLTVRPKDFGNVPALPKPLADAFCAVEHNRPFRIVRSFVPMEYRKGCRITSSVKLRGHSPAGGWGHVMFHRYRTAAGLVTYDPQRDVSGLAARFQGRLGLPPKATATLDERTLAAGESVALFSAEGKGALVETALSVKGFSPSTVTNLWLVYEFDGKRTVEAPLGTFFGCETPGKPARLETALLTFDTSNAQQARFSNRFPMPYFTSCRAWLENRSAGTVAGVSAAVGSDDTLVYDPKTTGLFTAARYLPKTRNVAGQNARIGSLVGRGQMAYGTITGWDFDHKKYGWGSCEGDVRCYVDDMTVPRVQSDGSESWGSWGWGFCSPPQVNPFSTYHTTNGEVLWSEMRLTYADTYPFRRFLRFDLEHGTSNNHAESSTSGQIFGYILKTER